MTKEIRLMVGIPASGKSTYIKKVCDDLFENGNTQYTVISRDAIRYDMTNGATGKEYFSKEKEVFNKMVEDVNAAIKNEVEVIFIDATHINKVSRRKIVSKLENIENYTLIVETFIVSADTAKKRNAKRTGFARVPDKVIDDMLARFEMPEIFEFKDLYGFKNIHLVNFYEKEGEDVD